MKLVVVFAVLIAFGLGLAAGSIDRTRDARRRDIAIVAMVYVVDHQPNHHALWQQVRQTVAEAQAKQ